MVPDGTPVLTGRCAAARSSQETCHPHPHALPSCDSRTSEANLCNGPVFITCWRPEKSNQVNHCCDECLRVKLSGQKNTPCDMLRFLVPPWQMNVWWWGGKDGGVELCVCDAERWNGRGPAVTGVREGCGGWGNMLSRADRMVCSSLELVQTQPAER